MIDQTFEKILLPSLVNLDVGIHPTGLNDLLTYFGSICQKEYKRIIITGAGRTLKDLKPNYNARLGDFVVGNQSTAARLKMAGIPPDMIVQCDPQPVASSMVRDYLGTLSRGDYPICVFATNTDWTWDPPHSALFYKALMMDVEGTNRLASLWNAIITRLNPEVESFIMQSGSVVNASVLIMAELVEHGVFRLTGPKEMWLAGVDFAEEPSFYDPKMEDRKLVFGGYRTTPELLSYYNDLKIIVKFLRSNGWNFKTMTEGLLEDFMEWNPGYKEVLS